MTQMSLELAYLEEMSRKPSAEDVSLARQLVAETPAFIGGSFLTNPDTANDIDLVISESEYFDQQEHFVKFMRTGGDTGYDTVHELSWTERYRSLNLLIVQDLFIGAYIKAAEMMQMNPKHYQTRKQRIALHQKLKNIIRSQHGIDLVDIEE